MSKTKAVLFVSTLAIFLATPSLRAQIDTGVLSGVIHDNSGGVIPAVEVSIVNLGTNYRVQVNTNASGLYVSPPLPAGEYQISVSLEGFQPAAKRVTLNLAERLGIDFTLQLGSVAEQITVEAQGVVLQTEQATLSTFRTEREVRELPMNDRNFAELMRYTPGAAPGQSQKSNLALSQQRGNTSSSVNGSSFADNNFVVDGIQNNSTHQGYGLLLFPEVEALDQYRVETSTPDARYGRSGATVNVGYKSGTNQFHGTLFHFFRNSALDARNFFASGEKPALRRNFFGGVLSGPLGGKDAKTFFLVSYEGRRTRLGKTFVSDVPTTSMKAGDFSELLGQAKPITIYDPLTTQRNSAGKLVRTPFANNVIPASMFNSAGAKLLNLYPDPNMAGLANNFLRNPSDIRDGDQYTVKVDRAFSGGSRGFVRYTQGNFNNIQTRELGLVASPNLLVDQPVYQLVPSYTHIFSPTVINQTRLGVSYQPLDNVEMSGNVPLAEQFGIPGVNLDDFTSGLPAITAPGLTRIGSLGCTPAVLHFTNYEVSNNTDMTRGNHSSASASTRCGATATCASPAIRAAHSRLA
ncbi:MAG: carboxypeptidase regulatory-like domain-containing protein [Bryobacterales bacterium]